jgi:hypothetical protein
VKQVQVSQKHTASIASFLLQKSFLKEIHTFSPRFLDIKNNSCVKITTRDFAIAKNTIFQLKISPPYCKNFSIWLKSQRRKEKRVLIQERSGCH